MRNGHPEFVRTNVGDVGRVVGVRSERFWITDTITDTDGEYEDQTIYAVSFSADVRGGWEPTVEDWPEDFVTGLDVVTALGAVA
jgi:hypothetical protein